MGIELGTKCLRNKHFFFSFLNQAIFLAMQVDAAAHPCDSSPQKVEAGESEGRTAT